MRTFILICLSTMCWTCQNDKQDTKGKISHESPKVTPIESPAKINQLDSFDNLVNKISQIKTLPFRELKVNRNGKIISIRNYCGDPVFWEIVKAGRPIVPNLINKILDSSRSNIKIQCRDELLNQGTIAYMILDKIISVPSSLTFKSQWDVLAINCDYGNSEGLLEWINRQPIRAHNDLVEWYLKYENKFQQKKIMERSKCQEEFDIQFEWECDY